MARETWVQKRKPDGTHEIVAKNDVPAWMEKHWPAKKAAPIQFKKIERGSWVWRDGKLVQKTAQVIPFRGHYIQGDIEPFKNIAVDGKVIGGRRQRRDMMKAHGLADGNDLKGMPDTPRYNEREHRVQVGEAIKHARYKLTGEY